jgi:hypothetical protein
VLTPAIFAHLEKIGQGAGGEIQLTDGIARLMKTQSVYAYRFEGKRYDCGNKLGYLQATVEFGLNHSTLGGPFRDYLLAERSLREKGRFRAAEEYWRKRIETLPPAPELSRSRLCRTSRTAKAPPSQQRRPRSARGREWTALTPSSSSSAA